MDFFDWDSDNEWSEKWLNWLFQELKRDWAERNFSIDFLDKLRQRRISLAMIRDSINNSNVYIARYWYGDGNRVGIWQPQTRLFVAWKPRYQRSPSRFMTAFRKSDGISYMQDFPPFREIRSPK